MLFWHGFPLGIDFRGGTLVDVNILTRPSQRHARDDERAGFHIARIQRFGTVDSDEILIDLPLKETSEQAWTAAKSDHLALRPTSPQASRT